MDARINFRIFFLCLIFLSLQVKADESANVNNLKNFALSNCLYQAFPDSKAGAEAMAAAGGYVELGAFDVEAYEEIVELGKVYLQKKYLSKGPGVQLSVMKCIDLSQSKELGDIFEKYSHELQNRVQK